MLFSAFPVAGIHVEKESVFTAGYGIFKLF